VQDALKLGRRGGEAALAGLPLLDVDLVGQ
jgi:hypothetical protein